MIEKYTDWLECAGYAMEVLGMQWRCWIFNGGAGANTKNFWYA